MTMTVHADYRGILLRQLARGKICQIRLPGICNFNSETTVLAHARLINLSGAGFKNDDFIAAHACSACHEYVDTHHDAETQFAFAQGVYRTQYILIHRYGFKLSLASHPG